MPYGTDTAADDTTAVFAGSKEGRIHTERAPGVPNGTSEVWFTEPKQSPCILARMGFYRPWTTAVLLAIQLLCEPAARATDICSALTEAEVSNAVGTALKRSPTDACRFGSGRSSVYLTMHAGGGSRFDTYASQARRDFHDVQPVVRGICCLRPGLPGLSENIRVTSIVGKFLEHSRVFYFHNGGDEQLYLGSADLMPRNIDHRVEVLFPVEDPKMLRRIHENILTLYLGDTVKARRMMSDGSYVRVKAGDGDREELNSQEWLLSSRRRLSEKLSRTRNRPRP